MTTKEAHHSLLCLSIQHGSCKFVNCYSCYNWAVIYICRPYHSLSFPWRIVEDAKEMIREWQKRYLQYYSVTGRRVLNRWRQTTLSTDYCSHTAYYLFFGRQIYDCFCYLPSILEPNRWKFTRFGSRITYTKAKTMKNCSIWLNNRHSPCCRSPSPLPQPQL